MTVAKVSEAVSLLSENESGLPFATLRDDASRMSGGRRGKRKKTFVGWFGCE